MFVELVQDQAHAIHETAHVRRLPIGVPGSAVRSKRRLKCFKVLHPFYSKVMRLNICFVEDQNEWKLGFVQDAGNEEMNGGYGEIYLG
jgi:hypothetical protein